MNERSAVLEASAEIEATPEQVRRWFLSLKEHPDRYQSETHSGFTFTEGSFGETGARFETRERLAGMPVRLRFELTAVEEERFAFGLLRPPLAIWGDLQIAPTARGNSLLSLRVGGENRCAEWVLGLPLLRGAIQAQIQREVSHVRSSVKRLLAEPSGPDLR